MGKNSRNYKIDSSQFRDPDLCRSEFKCDSNRKILEGNKINKFGLLHYLKTNAWDF